MTTYRFVRLLIGLALAGALSSYAAEPTRLDTQVRASLDLFQKSDPSMRDTIQHAYGYAIFPSVGKGAIGIGGAFGEGQVFEQGRLIGTAKLTQITLGAQLGGQQYAELICFENKDTLDQFRSGKLALAAQASVVAAASGASTDAKYQRGVLVSTVGNDGLMFEASVGGQKFRFIPLGSSMEGTATQPPAKSSTQPMEQPPSEPSADSPVHPVEPE